MLFRRALCVAENPAVSGTGGAGLRAQRSAPFRSPVLFGCGLVYHWGAPCEIYGINLYVYIYIYISIYIYIDGNIYWLSYSYIYGV